MKALCNISLRLLTFVVGCVAVLLGGCTSADGIKELEPVYEGDVVVKLDVGFNNRLPINDINKSRSDSNLIYGIDDLFVAFYNENGSLARTFYFEHNDLSISPADNSIAYEDCDAERTDAHAEASMIMQAGNYRIYAVANMGDLSVDSDYSQLLDDETSFRNIHFRWNNNDLSKNRQMSGFFTDKDDTATYDDAPVVELNRRDMTIHAWVRRQVSKVTVGFDGSNLNQNVHIYITSIQIRDIAQFGTLIDNNTPGTDEGGYTAETVGDALLIGEGEKHTYGTVEKYEDAEIYIAKGRPTWGDHSATADAFYFYENMQGTAPDKHQYNNNPSKDGKRYGTYVEVRGFYVNKNRDNPSHGSIKYRFMMGRNVTDDFNAVRNTHYKLTLKFRNNANDPDWHIEYDYIPTPPEVVAVTPMYISYLYDSRLDVPIRINHAAGTDWEVTNISAQITENEWGYEGHRFYSTYQDRLKYGFLTLKKISGTEERDDQVTLSKSGFASTPQNDTVTLATIPIYTRSLNVKAKGENDTSYRPQFSGNNLFAGHERTAMLDISVTFANGRTVSTTVEVRQVKRMVNPKGIWRSATCQDSFHIILTDGEPFSAANEESVTSSADAKSYTVLRSDGTWTAKILKGDWFKISATDGNYGTRKVTGDTGSDVEFWYKPNGPSGSTPRFGLIEVTYHGDSKCRHVICVSQGMGTVSIAGNNWKMANLKYAGVEAENPLMEGSMFKFGNSSQAIAATNNVRSGYGFNQKADTKNFDYYNASGTRLSATFNAIPAYVEGFTSAAMNVGNAAPATIAQYNALISATNLDRYYGVLYGDECNETQMTNDGAGGYVNLGDKKGMRGCFIVDSDTGNHLFFPIGATGYGRRMFANYANKPTGGNNDSCEDFTITKGCLKYGDRGAKMLDTYVTKFVFPLFFNLWKEYGAIYWAQTTTYSTNVTNTSTTITPASAMGLDINYYTMGLTTYASDRIWGIGEKNSITNDTGTVQSDAAFLRRVAK